MKKPEILMEDKDIIVMVKPDGMPSQGDKSMSQDMVSFIKTHIMETSDVKESPYVGLVHRLDRPVGGVMVFAKNKEAAADLSEQVKNGSMTKYYQAVLRGHLPDFEGTFEDYLVKDTKTNMSRVCSADTKDAKKAILHYEMLDEIETDQGVYSYVLIELETGRHHQIRCQMAHHNVPIYGDSKYGKGKGPKQIGLISTRLEFDHPRTKEHLVFKTEPWGDAFAILDTDEW